MTGVSGIHVVVIVYTLVLDDDSSHLSEVLELFSDITLPLKVDKLIKVR